MSIYLPAFAQVQTGAEYRSFIATSHIVSLVQRDELDPPRWIATTVNNMTFRLSPEIAERLLHGAVQAQHPTDVAP